MKRGVVASATEGNYLNPMVSILIPVSGNPVYLSETIRSVLDQTYENIEVIIVLNNADSWVERYLQKTTNLDKRFQILKTTEKGISNALNLGLKRISHSLVCRLDSDDLMDPERVKKQVEFLSNNPDVGVVGSQIKRISKDGKFINTSKFPRNRNDIKNCLSIRNVMAHSSVMFRKELVEEAGGYQSQLNGAEDYDLWMRLRKKTEFVNLDESLTTYRIWISQATSKNRFLTHQLVRLIHTREFGDLPLKPFSLELEPNKVRHLSRRYYLESSVHSLAKFRVRKVVKLAGAISLDSGIEKLKMEKSIFYKAVGLVQVAVGSLVFSREMFKTFLRPLVPWRFANDKY